MSWNKGSTYGFDSDPAGVWRKQAACLDYDPELWFPVSEKLAGPAKEICRSCPVRVECLAAAEREAFGVWGGLTARQRSAQDRAARLIADRPLPCGTPSAYRRHIAHGEEACPPCLEAHRVESEQSRRAARR